MEKKWAPINQLAFLLATISSDGDLEEVARHIEFEAWPVDPGYEDAQGNNLLEIFLGNQNVRRLSTPLEVAHALVRKGVQVREKCAYSPSPGVKMLTPAYIYLRGILEGESADTMHAACRVLGMMRPAESVIEQSKRIQKMVDDIGGWSQSVQGLPLALWLAAHDGHEHHGGCVHFMAHDQSELVKLHRQAKRVYGKAIEELEAKGYASSSLLLLKKKLMYHDRGYDLVLDPEIETPAPGQISEFLSQYQAAPCRIMSLAGAQLLQWVVKSAIKEKSQPPHAGKFTDHYLDDIMDVFATMAKNKAIPLRFNPCELNNAVAEVLFPAVVGDLQERHATARFVDVFLERMLIVFTQSYRDFPARQVCDLVAHDANLVNLVKERFEDRLAYLNSVAKTRVEDFKVPLAQVNALHLATHMDAATPKARSNRSSPRL